MSSARGQGGTFYQAFDVTEAGMGVDPDATTWRRHRRCWRSSTRPTSRSCSSGRSRTTRSFDPTYTATFTVTDGTPGGSVKLFGDVSAAASYAEKTVGFTWSDPRSVR